MQLSVPCASATIESLSPAATVIDVGCFGWRLADACRRLGHVLVGLDECEPPGRPEGVRFSRLHQETVDLPDDTANLAVVGHVLEHVADPVAFFAEILRVTRPGGLVWVEAPSEIAATGRSSDCPEDHAFDSFWDDPTHRRPYTPGALYRLALSCRSRPIAIGRVMADTIPSVRMLALKPWDCSGAPPVRYVSLRGVPAGLAAAWTFVWSTKLPPLGAHAVHGEGEGTTEVGWADASAQRAPQ